MRVYRKIENQILETNANKRNVLKSSEASYKIFKPKRIERIRVQQQNIILRLSISFSSWYFLPTVFIIVVPNGMEMRQWGELTLTPSIQPDGRWHH